MRLYPIDLLEIFDGSRMVVTALCQSCEAYSVAYWHGGVTVNFFVTIECQYMTDGVWTINELAKMPVWEVERVMRELLADDACLCSVEDLGVA